MAEELKKTNIYEKLQRARVDLQETEIKKTGYNKYSNYNYFELSDFLPHINKIALNNGLANIFQYDSNYATLTVVDLDNTDITITFGTPIEVPQLKGCSGIQNIGGTQSYARRYLYIMAYEIAESDTIDGGEIDGDAELGKQRINKASVLTIKSLIDETGTDSKKFLEWAGVSKVEEITNAALGTCINMLNKKKKDNEFHKKEQEKLQKELDKQKENEDFDF